MIEVHIHVGEDETVSVKRSPPKKVMGRKTQERRNYPTIEDALVATWWSKSMFRPFQQGILTWQTYNGAVEAVRSGHAVEIVSAEMVHEESNLKLLNAFKIARGKHLATTKVVQKMLMEGLIIGRQRSIDENIVKSYIADTIDVLQQAWGGERGLSNKKVEDLKATVYQSEFSLDA